MYDKKTGHLTEIIVFLASNFLSARVPKASLWDPHFNVELLMFVHFEMTKKLDSSWDSALFINIDLGSAEGTDRSGSFVVISI